MGYVVQRGQEARMRKIMCAMWVLLCIQMLALVTAPAEAKLRPGQASMRVALVIGNSTYPQPLANPAHDVELVAKAARDAGFHTVVTGLDLDAEGLKQAIRDFKQKANGANVALVYFAGNGLQSDGRHWLVGSHAEENAGETAASHSVDMADVLDAVAGAKIRLVALDACFLGEYSETQAQLLPMPGRFDQAGNSLILYAAQPGREVLDSAGEGTSNSPFAISFARRLGNGATPVQMVGDLVRLDVYTATHNSPLKQLPFIAENIEGDLFYLKQSESP